MNETEQYHLQRLIEKFIRTDPARRHAALRQCTSLIRRTAALASNEHQVWTKLEAVETKLRIDGQDAAADFLRQRVEYLVPPPSPEMLETERLHYAVLDLLLHMMPSLNPTVMSRVITQSQLAQELARRREQSKPPPITAAEVYKGLEPYAPPTYAPSSPGSPRSASSSSSSSDHGDHDHDPNMDMDPMHQHSFGDQVPPPADPLPWLAHLAALQYWRRAPTSLPPTTFSAHDPHTLAFANAHHTSINTPADPVPFPATVVTEADLVRECLLALRRMPTWLFALSPDGKLRVARRVALTHLAIDTLSTVLAQVARAASKLIPVHEFATHPSNRHASDPVLAAFVLGVQMELDALDSELSKLEVGLQHTLLWQQQSAGPRKASLISLNRRIPQLTEFVVALGDFLDASLGSTNSAASGTVLLDRLVDQLSASQLSSQFPNWLRLFLTTFSAHCVHLDRWLNEGQVLAPDSFFIRTVPPPSPDEAGADDAQEFDVWRHGFLVDASKTPRLFPADLVDRMLVIGKSVALSRTRASPTPASSAHMLALAKDITATSFSPPPAHTRTTYYSAFTAHLHPLTIDPTTCPLADLLTPTRRLTSTDLRLARPIKPILAACATTALQPYLHHSAHVVSRFIANYRIDAHLALVSSVYLMENGAEWTQALAPIFRRIKRRRAWASADVVNETIGAAVARMRRACGMLAGNDKGGGMQVGVVEGRDALSSVYASYRPAWPVNLVVAAGHVGLYNRVLTALLYLRQAKYLLEDEAYVAIRRLRSRKWDNVLGLRFQLVHFVHAVEAFWLVGVIDGERHALRQKMRRAQTVDALIEAHDAFVNRVVDLMLLRTTPLSDAIGQVFGLCSEFAAVFDHLVWSQFVDQGTTQATVEWKPKLMARFRDIYDRFTAIRRFLVTSLDIMATKGNAVHLESLLYALSTESDGGLLWQ